MGAARPLPPSADIGPGGQSVGQAAQFCLVARWHRSSCVCARDARWCFRLARDRKFLARDNKTCTRAEGTVACEKLSAGNCRQPFMAHHNGARLADKEETD